MVTFLFEEKKNKNKNTYVLINTVETLTKQTYKVTSTLKKEKQQKVLLYNSYITYFLFTIFKYRKHSPAIL